VTIEFWIKRFFTVLVGAFVVICAARLIRGHGLETAILDGALWAAITATVFTVARYFQSRRGQHCAICRDTPEMRPLEPGGDA
jgi:multisubunit Na+/H+ antiporter MnhF subunit